MVLLPMLYDSKRALGYYYLQHFSAPKSKPHNECLLVDRDCGLDLNNSSIPILGSSSSCEVYLLTSYVLVIAQQSTGGVA